MALKVEGLDSREKITTGDPGHTASEDNAHIFWLAEGIGPVRMEWSKTREYYWDYELVATAGGHEVLALVREPATLALLAIGLLSVIRRKI